MDTQELKLSSAKMIGGAGLAWYSVYSLQEWVAIVTIAYVLLQVGLLLPKYWVAVQKVYSVCSKFIQTKLKEFKNEHRKKRGR